MNFKRLFGVLFADAFRRKVFCLALSAPALAWSFISRGAHAHGAAGWTPGMFTDPAWIPLMLCGAPIIAHAARKLLREGNIRAGLLVSVAMLAAVATGEIFAAGEVAFIMALGEALEERTVDRARANIRALVSLAPKQVCILRCGVEESAQVDSIVAGDVIRVRPGETVAADGVVVRGASSMDQALVTGESLPVEKTAGDAVIAGSINRFGSVDIRATCDAKDSTLKKIQSLIADADRCKAPVVLAADRAASILIPLSFATAVATAFVTGDVLRAVTILVVFCPCALALATPTAVMAGMANLSKHGVLVKNGAALERMGRISTVAFDKTGTLTTGRLRVASAEPPELLRLAASAEKPSEHPAGRAIAAACPDAPEPESFTMIPGNGVEARVDGRAVLVGTRAFLRSRGVEPPQSSNAERAAAESGGTVVFAAAGGVFAGTVSLTDTLRPDARGTVAALRGSGVRETVILSGDARGAVGEIAAESGVDSFHAALSPQDKVARVSEMRAAGRAVAMVGDGVNDAAAMKAATVGVAMGGVGSDVAVEAADIVLMRGDISALPHLADVSRRVLRKIMFNITISLCVNAGAIALAMLGHMGAAAGALVHNAGSLLVVGNAALLLRVKPRAAIREGVAHVA